MAAGTLDLTIEQGAEFSAALVLRDGAGEALDLTGWEFAAQIRPSVDADDCVDLHSDTSAAADGQVRLYLSASETAAMPWPGVWDCEYTAAGQTYKLLRGRVNLVREVTR